MMLEKTKKKSQNVGKEIKMKREMIEEKIEKS
jgi:hypothetical protein